MHLSSGESRKFGELHEDVPWGIVVGDGSACWNQVTGDQQPKKDKKDYGPINEG